jgi:hypothetical protein
LIVLIVFFLRPRCGGRRSSGTGGKKTSGFKPGVRFPPYPAGNRRAVG